MKHKHYRILAITLVISCAFGFQAAEDPLFLKKIVESLKQYNTSYPEEKVYLQLDKPFYKPGDDIWFNAFVLNSNTHRPTGVSDVLYVELIDPKGNVATRLDLVIREGTAHGDFALKTDAPGGLYQVRAYTHWMKNFGNDNLFKKELQVQRVYTPRFLLRLDYEKESYGAGELVTAKLGIKNLKNEKVANADVGVTVKIDGAPVFRSQIQSDAKGDASIQFKLPDTLKTTDGLLQLIVKANGLEESISRSVPIVLNKIALQFFPEGGNWLHDVNSTVAFKALNEFGKGADVKGAIIDQEGKTVTTFESFHMGMGAFRLKPLRGSRYFARIESPPGTHTPVPLPDPTTGFLLNLINKADTTLRWAIHSPNDTYAYLVAQSHGEIVLTKRIALAKGSNDISVPTTKFPAGIAVFTLFDGEGVEQCERLVFLNNNKGLSIQLRTSKQRYMPGEKVKVDIKTADHHGNPIPAKISLAVVDDQLISFADDKQDHILSSLLLSSEVKGEIQEPSFYFDPDEEKASEALDYLLMTQGWRRFTWEDVRKNNRVITHSPEKNRNLGGVLVNEQREGISGEVALVELGGKKRIAKVRTTRGGYFIFKNIDPTIPLLLLTKKPGEISLKKEMPFSISLNDRDGTILHAEPLNEAQLPTIRSTADGTREQITAEGDLDMSLSADVSELSEVVITSFGVEEKKAFTSSIVTVHRDGEGMFNGLAPESAFQGRVAGVMVQPQTGNAGAHVNLMIRGLSSLAGGHGEPLYVIDGHPIGTTLDQNFSNGSFVSPNNIRSVEVVHSPEATALYGSAAANGAILITTRSRLGFDHFQTKKRKARYSHLTISPRKFSPVREFYVPSTHASKGPRNDFRTTIFWAHSIVTDARGNASVSFHNNDAVSAFRMTAEGFSGSGLVGRKEEVYHTELPLSLDVKLPEFLGYEDVLTLPVRIKNETSSARSAKVTLALPEALAAAEPLTREIEVKPKSTETVWFTVTSRGIEGEFPISVKLSSEDHSDNTDEVIRVRAVGFPMRLSYSARDLDKTFSVSIQDAEKNSVVAEFTAFPDVLSDLFTGAESILREPHGCFEQVSSSTFPNILALQFLQQSDLIKPEVEKRASSFIQNGYGKLVAYEIKGGGFEWFGHPPAHEGLTAYGLLEFHEMKKVYKGVDEKMMNRTRDFLLSRRNGQGGFRQLTGKYGFSAAREEVTNAYIVYALSETGTKNIMAEYRQALAEANNSKDLYRMALMANAAFNMQQMNDYSSLIAYFRETMETKGFADLKADHSIVRSYGESLQNEILSLWIIAMLKSPSPDAAFSNACIRHLLSKRARGQFGSTQATALALQALTAYASRVRAARDDGNIQLFVDNTLADRISYEKDTREKLVLRDLTNGLHQGNQTIWVLFGETKEPLPYSIDIQWNTKKPQSSDLCQVALTTALSAEAVRLNETVRMTITLKNKTSDGLPMTTAVIGIPAGLSLQPWQLKELQEKGLFDFYEVIDGNLVVYYREMAPNGELQINVDLKAEIPGQFVARASSVYLYYADEFKHWVAGNSIAIQ